MIEPPPSRFALPPPFASLEPFCGPSSSGPVCFDSVNSCARPFSVLQSREIGLIYLDSPGFTQSFPRRKHPVAPSRGPAPHFSFCIGPEKKEAKKRRRVSFRRRLRVVIRDPRPFPFTPPAPLPGGSLVSSFLPTPGHPSYRGFWSTGSTCTSTSAIAGFAVRTASFT